MCSEGPSASAYIRNLRKPMSLSRKLRLIARNQWVRVTTRGTCCGHPGEPGC